MHNINLTADLTKLKNHSDARKMPSYRDKMQHYKTLVVQIDGIMRPVVQISFKYPRDGAGRISCIVLIYDYVKGCCWGAGTASGYGYCKRSAAVQNAFNDVGIILSEDISGRGESMIEDACLTVASTSYNTTFTTYGSNPNAIFVG